MALKYTGRANTLQVNGKIYAQPALYKKNPSFYHGSFDTPIPGISHQLAAHLVAQSNLHSFEENGDDLLEKLSAPAGVDDISTVRPDAPILKDK